MPSITYFMMRTAGGARLEACMAVLRLVFLSAARFPDSLKVGGSQFHQAAAARRFRGGIGQRQRADPLLGADQRRCTARNDGNEMIELAAICFRIALQKKAAACR